jgi:hypothetical protein
MTAPALEILPPCEAPARIGVRVDLPPPAVIALADEATRLGLRLPAYVAFVLSREAARIDKANDLTTYQTT